MKKELLLRSFLIPALLVLLFTSCKKDSTHENLDEISSSAARNPSAAAENDLLKAVRQATNKYHSTQQAIMAGYEPDDHCVSVPGLGGMGYHWVNFSLVDPVFDPLKPEAVLYATGPGGNLRIVALEYIVINTGQPAPTFDGQAFDVNGAPLPIPHWTLHVWLYENNPSGMFTPFNPNVSCP